MIWHLPHLRALAHHVGGRVTLVARPRSLANQLVGPADGIEGVFWIERDQWITAGRHQGLGGLRRLIADLRAQRFDAAILLTRSRTLAVVAAAAGIPRRHGYGIGPQRPFLNRPPFLPAAAYRLHPYDQAGAWLQAASIPLPDPEPRLIVDPAARQAVWERLSRVEAPLVVLGIGASDAWKRWGPDPFAALATRLLAQGWPALVLLGGDAERADAEAVLALLTPADAARISTALDWGLRDVAALLQQAAFYVGNDTAGLNIAAAVGTRAYGLFGATQVLRHSRQIVPIVPPGGPDEDTGMARIAVGAVLDAIAADRQRPDTASAPLQMRASHTD